MTARKGIHIFGAYVVNHKLYALFIYVLHILKHERSDRIVLYIVFKNQRPFDTAF